MIQHQTMGHGRNPSPAQNKVGIGICLRDENGSFVLTKIDCFSSLVDVDTSEAIGLLIVIQWVWDLYLTNVDFELDSKNVVYKFHTKGEDFLDYDVIIQVCRSISTICFLINFGVEFTMR
jgi:hypothetical protein